MNELLSITCKRIALFSAVSFLIICAIQPLRADVWNVTAGAQSGDKARQALGFLPNEVWIHVGDTIQWTFGSDEIHTVTFLTSNLPRPPLFDALHNFIGCPGVGVTPSGSSFNNSSCVTSVPSTTGQTYSVTFPTPNSYKLVCLVHPDMTGLIHVLSSSSSLPHDQAFYDHEAQTQREVLIAGASNLTGPGSTAEEGTVTAGISAIISTGGGAQTASLTRFLQSQIVIKVGDTVEWTSRDASIPHTITLGAEPADPRAPSSNVSMSFDGARQALIGSPSDSVNSGILVPTTQDRPGLVESPPGATRFRVTFMVPGVFNYICALHDNLGMTGTVIVH